MSIQFLGSFNKIVNDTVTEVINGEIVHRAEDIVVTVLSSGISLIDSALLKVQSLTETDPAPDPAPDEV